MFSGSQFVHDPAPGTLATFLLTLPAVRKKVSKLLDKDNVKVNKKSYLISFVNKTKVFI